MRIGGMGPSGTGDGRSGKLRGTLRSCSFTVPLLLLCSLRALAAPPVGQWIWTGRDRGIFAESQKVLPELRGAPWVSTLTVERGALAQRLAQPPQVAGAPARMLLVRFDDRVAGLFASLDDATLAAQVDARLRALLDAVGRSGASPSEVQLDFDCPVRLLPRYATLVKALGQGALRGRAIWLTSIYSHVRAPAYGALFQGLVAGHILQLFDTGDGLRPSQADEVVRTVEQQGLPFQLGLGAFERHRGHASTHHREWFSARAAFERSPLYRGLWIFPGGQRWLPLVEVKP